MKTRYDIIYRYHGDDWSKMTVDTFGEAKRIKDLLIEGYIVSDIKIFETVDNRCVFDAVNLIDMKEVA
tara:strand:- start:252 stop:455 length:204 start_codon:yes stop_codon:yes gene_type:complete